MPLELKTPPLPLLGLDPSHRPALRKVSVHLSILAVMMLAIWWMPTPPGVNGVAGYEPLHTFFETISVIICALIFTVTWNAPRRHVAGNMVLLACAFAGVAVLDFSHLLSVQGMPDYVTPSDPEKAINFWLAARLLAATALLIFALRDPHRQYSTAVQCGVLMAVVVAIAMVHVLVLLYPQLTPRTFIKGQGLTDFKRAAEYGLIGLNIAAIVCLWWQMRKPLPYNAAAVVGAIAAMGMSEFFLTLYSDVTDVYLVAGHVYKVISYLYLYRAIFVETIDRPYLELHASREALQRSREDLAITLNSIGDAVIATDAQGLITRMNPVAERLTGWPQADAMGQPLTAVFRIISAETRLPSINPVQRVMERGETVGLANHTALLARDGQEYQIADSAAPIRDATQAIVGVVLVFSDVTEKYRVEEALRASEERFANIVNLAEDAIISVDEEQRILIFNYGAEQIFGYKAAEMLGQPLDRLLPARYAEAHRGHIRQFGTAQPTARHMGKHRDVLGLRRDGSEFFAEASISQVMENGKQVFTVFLRDISARKQAEEEIVAVKERMRMGQLFANIGTWEWNIQSGELFWTERIAALFGYAEGKLETSYDNFLAALHPDDRPLVVAAISACVERDMPYDIEHRVVWADGTVHWLLERGSVVRDTQGNAVTMLGVVQDIDGRKRAAAELVAALREKTALLLEVHHRVKNNLQVITSLLRLEGFRSTDAPTKAVLQDMQGRVRSMALLHETIYRKGTFAAIDLASYVGQIAGESLKSLQTTPDAVQLRLELDSVHVGLDQATPTGMLVSELVSNCLKHAFPAGRTGEIAIRLHPLEAPGHWRLVVSDNGIGLPADFEAKRKNSLGLQLAGDLAQQMSGKLQLGPGPQAVFTVDFKAESQLPIVNHMGSLKS